MSVIKRVRIVKADTDDLMEKVRQVREVVFIREQDVPYDREYDRFEESSVHYLALLDGKPAGCVRYRRLDGDVKIERLAVVKDRRGEGLGRLLMDHVESESLVLKPGQFILNSQVTAIPFYEKCGYRPVGSVFLDAGIDHRKMVKEAD